MDATYSEILKNLVVAGAGGIVVILFEKIRNKTACISYRWVCNRIALSANDSIFGDVRVTWQGHSVRNLHMFVFEIENTTTTDFENVGLRIFTENETLILNEKTEILDSPYIVKWSDEYQSRQFVTPNDQPTESQIFEHHHNREYSLPVFNRNQKIRLSYLCNRPGDDELPMLFITTPSRGIRLKLVPSPSITLNPIWGVPIPSAIVRALILSVFVVLVCAIYIQDVAIASLVCMVVGLSGQFFGAVLYKVERFFRKVVSE